MLEDKVDRRLSEYDRRFDRLNDKVDLVIKSSIPPREGILFDGQIFDAYFIASQIIRMAQKRVVLIDNYIDGTVLYQLGKRNAGVKAIIYTLPLSKEQKIDVKRYNAQYPSCGNQGL